MAIIYMDEKLTVAELEEISLENIREQLLKLDRLFSEKEQGDNGVPTAKEIEQMWGDLLSETKDIYAKHISERLNNVDEKPIIQRKKENI